MSNYIVDVRGILSETGAVLGLEDELPLASLVVGDNEFTALGPVRVDVSVSNVGSGIAVIGSASLDVGAECARCLCEFRTTISGDVQGLYLDRGQEADDAEEAEPVSEAGTVDLWPAIHAALVAEAPYVPLHDENCQGLCPGCGADLNTDECSCNGATGESHPFAALQGLLEDDGES